jgi:hypothetical protein
MAREEQDLEAIPPADTDHSTGGARSGNAADPPRQRGITAHDIEALETDGKGTGGVGEDLGGHVPLPEED